MPSSNVSALENLVLLTTAGSMLPTRSSSGCPGSYESSGFPGILLTGDKGTELGTFYVQSLFSSTAMLQPVLYLIPQSPSRNTELFPSPCGKDMILMQI